MSIYQKVTLSGPSPVGQPSALPADVSGLADADLADLSWSSLAEHQGVGYWPLTVNIPTHNPATQIVTDAVQNVTLDPEAKRATATAILAPAPVPIAIDMRQASLMLDAAPHGEGTRLDAVDAYLATQSRRVQIEWARASVLRRDHPMVAIMAVFFNQTEADVDQFFRDGAAIGPTLTL